MGKERKKQKKDKKIKRYFLKNLKIDGQLHQELKQEAISKGVFLADLVDYKLRRK